MKKATKAKSTKLPAETERLLSAVRMIVEELHPLEPKDRLRVIDDVRQRLGLWR